jgi:hypothetical protein
MVNAQYPSKNLLTVLRQRDIEHASGSRCVQGGIHRGRTILKMKRSFFRQITLSMPSAGNLRN